VGARCHPPVIAGLVLICNIVAPGHYSLSLSQLVKIVPNLDPARAHYIYTQRGDILRPALLIIVESQNGPARISVRAIFAACNLNVGRMVRLELSYQLGPLF
jgi:hypothetical protein